MVTAVPALAEGGMVAFGGIRMALADDEAAGTAVTIGIRPEFVRLTDNVQDALAAHVERIEFLGSEVILYSKLDAIGETMIAKLTPAEAAGLAIGKPVALTLSPDKAMVFAADGRRLRATPVAVDSVKERAHG
jgi:multiple sugar transport system ATP-binding protein